MTQSVRDVNRRSEFFADRSKAEQKVSPDVVETSTSLRVSTLRKAFCKVAAPAAITIACFLDVDSTGPEVTVSCSIAGGGNLNSAVPRLADGTLIFISLFANTWWCITPFQASEDCS